MTSARLTPQDLADRVRVFDVDQLELLADNPNRADMQALARSVDEFGQIDTILVQDGVVVDGNHRVLDERSNRRFGGRLAGIDITGLDWTQARAAAAGVGLNITARLGADDPQALQRFLQRIADEDTALLRALSYQDDLTPLPQDDLHPWPTPPQPDQEDGWGVEGDPDDIPDTAPAISQPGDLWTLGHHRLYVGSALNPDSYLHLLDGQPVQLVWTDPPYGVAYRGISRKRDAIENDNLNHTQLAEFLTTAFTHTIGHTVEGACWFVAAPPGPTTHIFGQVLTNLAIWRQTIIWVKDTFVLSHADYHNRHEVLYYGWTPGSHQRTPDRKQDSVWEFPRPRRSDDHPTMKPVALIERSITNHTQPGNLILDPFAGSGSTLIAAQATGRHAHLIELDPGYCDVICRRFQQLTGITPIRDGTPHTFTDTNATTPTQTP